jgi:hypothetical protein
MTTSATMMIQMASRSVVPLRTPPLPSAVDGNPQEQEAADDLPPRDRQQIGRDGDEADAHGDGAHRAPNTAEELMAPRQCPHGERDHDRVVPREREIDDHDLCDADEILDRHGSGSNRPPARTSRAADP